MESKFKLFQHYYMAEYSKRIFVLNILFQVKRYARVMNMFMETYGQSCLYTNFTDFVEDIKKDDFASSSKTCR